MIVKLLTEHYLEFLSLTGGCGVSSESTLVKMSNCWKSQSTAQLYLHRLNQFLLLIDANKRWPNYNSNQIAYSYRTSFV